MKRKNKKLTTLILAGALSLSAFLGTALVSASADETTTEAKKYNLTSIFSANSATIGAETLEGESAKTTKFSFMKDSKSNDVSIKRNLAFKWFAGKDDARYLTIKFAFGQMSSMQSVDFEINAESSLTSDRAKNVVRFEKTETGVCAYVVADGATDEEINESKANALALDVTDGTEITISLTEEKPAGADDAFEYAYDEFGVKVNDTVIGTFTHVGANYASNALKISAVAVEGATADPVVYLDDINGQAFNNIVTDGETHNVTDTAAPVLVANETLNGFLLGAKYAFDYEVVDVLQSSSLGDVDKYYQFNPADKETGEYKSLGTTYFMDTNYYVDANGNYTKDAETDGVKNTLKNVYQEYGNEYVSIQVTVSDDSFKDNVIDLSWYANEDATEALKVGDKEIDFIKVNTSIIAPVYNYIGTGEEVISDEVKAALAERVAAYNVELQEKADKVYAGTNATCELPALDWLFEDDNGYSGLKFTICYKTVSSSSLTKANLAHNALKIPTTTVGKYEFKVFAIDKSNNAMKYMLDGELVEVNSSNIWDIEDIPVFEFEVFNLGLRVEEKTGADEDDRTVKKTVDSTYSLSGLTAVGGSSQKTSYALYKFDLIGYNNEVASEKELTRKLIASVAYEEIRVKMLDNLYRVNVEGDKYYGDYFQLYLDTYAELLAAEVGGNAATILKYMDKIEVYDNDITEDDDAWDASDNKYQFKGSNSFKAAEEGEYLMFVDYCDTLLPTVSRAVAYKLVVVDSEVDTIKGETQWLKNNIVSVILFGIAGVMLILIIVLLLIKPSDETLEDVDKDGKKAKKANKK